MYQDPLQVAQVLDLLTEVVVDLQEAVAEEEAAVEEANKHCFIFNFN